MSNMRYALEYTRASTNHQEYSVGDQHKFNSDWAKRNKVKIVKTYCDDGISGSSAAKRPHFLQLVEDITTGKYPDVTLLLIWDSFRFARNMLELLLYKDMFKKHGLQVIATAEPYVEDEDAQLYLDAINGASGELYLRKLSKDCKRGIRSKVVNRHEHIGFAPYGYRTNPYTHKLEILEEEARWVRYMFQSVVDDVPYLQICKALRDSNVCTRKGCRWTNVQVMYVLTNKTYCGLLEVNLDGKHGVYDGNHPIIIAPDLFDRVQDIIAKRKARHKPYARSTNKYVHWLSGLMKCPYCGGSLSYQRGYNGRKDRYGCNARMDGRGCKNLSIKVSVAASYVLDQLQQIYAVPDTIYSLKTVTPKPVNQVDYDSEIRKLRGQLTRAKKAYMEEIDTIEEYRENKARITAAIDELEVKKNAADIVQFDPAAFQDKCLSALSLLQSDADMEQKAAVSHNLIEKIECDNINKVLTIYFYT